jgi:hypothetical protein
MADCVLVLNIDQGNFIRVDSIGSFEYYRKLRNLLTPEENDDFDDVSHWSRTDKIVQVPAHLNAHVIKNYGEISYFD